MITVIEYAQLFALITFAGFMSYTAYEVGNAVQDMFDEMWLTQQKKFDRIHAQENDNPRG